MKERPPPCLVAGQASARALTARAGETLDRGDARRALACAEEALRVASRYAPALHLRAEALAELGRLDEARLAFAHALAVDPDDPETLLGAADLYLTRVQAEHGALALGLEYARRGTRAALRARRPDRALAARLLLLSAMAENDLGDSRSALLHAGEARSMGADPIDAEYERGVALFELCRFRESRASLERVLRAQPDDAWAIHQLSLVAEATGDVPRAERLARRASELDADSFPAAVDIDAQAFEDEVRRAVASMPPDEQRALSTVPVEVVDRPSLEDLKAVDPPLSPSILGLFRGPPEGDRCLPEDGPRCRSIVLYRHNLARFARSRSELSEQVKVTLLHELGHLHGESDEDLRARGLE